MPDAIAITIRRAESASDIELARELFREYADTIGGHICFQSFETELLQLPGDYASPRGRLYLAFAGSELAGCIALRPLAADVCEMKRLWVRPGYRRFGIGRILADRLLADAREIGYARMNLDTLDTMQSAQRLYESLGFVDQAAGNIQPEPGVRYMTLSFR